MRRLKTVILAAVLAVCLSVSAFGQDIFAIKSVLGTPDPLVDCVISVTAGEVLEFSAADLERRLQLEGGGLNGITITGLPSLSQGALYLDGVEVELYDYLNREELDRLCFVHVENVPGANVVFLPQSRDPVATNLAIQVLASENEPPVIEDTALETMKNIAKYGTVSAYDPEGGGVSLQLINKPQKGTVTFDGLSFLYQPYQDTAGSDQFTVCAVDSASAYSREAVVTVHIAKTSSTIFYKDMSGNPSTYAAVMLHENNVMTGEKTGSAYFFGPDEMTTRGDFLVMLIAAAGLEDKMQPTVNTGLPNDSQLPNWIKPYLRVAIDADIVSSEYAFNFDEIPTRAEAVVLTDRAAGISDVKDYGLALPDLDSIPEWALPSYKDLAAYKMLDLYSGYAHPNGALTNSYAADLVWQLYKHCHR